MELHPKIEQKIRRRIKRAVLSGKATHRVRLFENAINKKRSGLYILRHHTQPIPFRLDKLNRVYLEK